MTAPRAHPRLRSDLRLGQKLWHAQMRIWVTVGYTSHHVDAAHVRVHTADGDLTVLVAELRWDKP